MRRAISILGVVVVLLVCGQACGTVFTPGLYATRNSDSGGNCVFRIASNGTYSTAMSFDANVRPIGLAFYDQERLGISFGTGPSGLYWGNYRIFDGQGTAIAFIDHIPATNVWENHSFGSGFAIGADDTVYLSTHNSPGATKISPTGQVSDWTGYNYDLWWGKDAAIAPDGKLYMTHGLEQGEAYNFTIKEINITTGAATTILDNLNWTIGIAFDAANNMYFSQNRANKIVLFQRIWHRMEARLGNGFLAG